MFVRGPFFRFRVVPQGLPPVVRDFASRQGAYAEKSFGTLAFQRLPLHSKVPLRDGVFLRGAFLYQQKHWSGSQAQAMLDIQYEPFHMTYS